MEQYSIMTRDPISYPHQISEAARVPLSAAQKRRVAALIKDSSKGCANFWDGGHHGSPQGCSQINADELYCSCFVAAVLPLDAALSAELAGGKSVRYCQGCGQPVPMNSNSSKYCPDCAKKERRRRDSARKRAKRLQRPQIG